MPSTRPTVAYSQRSSSTLAGALKAFDDWKPSAFPPEPKSSLEPPPNYNPAASLIKQ